MGSDLYINIETYYNDRWVPIFDGPSAPLGRWSIVDAFGDAREDEDMTSAPGYLASWKVREMAQHPECPWRLDEPYWVRLIEGAEFIAIIQEKRWQKLRFGADIECRHTLRGFAALVESILKEGVPVRVYAWHSQ